ncbi:MAG: hypothetical protein IIA05_11940 [Proteobacteria bacterium]|nr:hypothetical protein [Pseudomonadota bacterium]
MSTTESELKKAVRDAEERVQILREKLLEFTANIKYDDQSHTVPESDNEKWIKVSTELEETEAALTDAQSELLYFISGNR